MKLAVVIPTLNEKSYIGKLLKCLRQQSWQDFEVIVVDGQSEDKTIQVVNSWTERFSGRLQVIAASKRNISQQRNLGAKVSTSKAILFLDADVRLPPRFMEILVNKTDGGGWDCVSCLNWPASGRGAGRIIMVLFNGIFWISQWIWPVAVGANIWVKRKAFEEVGGFDETVVVAEDIDLLQRLKRRGKRYRFLLQPKIYFDTRRIEEEGWWPYLKLIIKGSVLYLKRGPIRSATELNYEFGKHDGN